VDVNTLSTSKKLKKMHVHENIKALEAELRNEVSSCDVQSTSESLLYFMHFKHFTPSNLWLYDACNCMLLYQLRKIAEELQLQVDDAHALLESKSKQLISVELQLQRANRQATQQIIQISDLLAASAGLRGEQVERDSLERQMEVEQSKVKHHTFLFSSEEITTSELCYVSQSELCLEVYPK
jgi:hypothetical protein